MSPRPRACPLGLAPGPDRHGPGRAGSPVPRPAGPTIARGRRRAVVRARHAVLISGSRSGLLSHAMDEARHIPPGCTRPRVLVVDDDPDIGTLLERYLGSRGLDVHVVQSAGELARELDRRRFDILLLDLGLPDGDGLDALRELRRVWHGPLLIISGRGDSAERAIGLELGADDFIAKPFDLRELLARIHAVRRRATAPQGVPPPLEIDGLHIDVGSRTVVGRDGEPIGLTRGEFDLLTALLRKAGATVSRDELMNALHGHEAGPFDRAIDVQISRLRRKIERDSSHPRLIESVRGAGYRLGMRRH